MLTHRSHTKIVCTLGPKTANEEAFMRLLQAGLGMVRLNGSHNTLEWHSRVIAMVRKCSPLTPILLDIPGRKVRVSADLSPKTLQVGDGLFFGEESKGDVIGITNPSLLDVVKPGSFILADDGTLKFEVVEVKSKVIHCKSLSKGVLRPSKGLNFPGLRLQGELISARDKSLLDFAIREKIDFVGLSFADEAKHVEEYRSYLKSSSVGIVAKVETAGGLESCEGIVRSADGVMIDRGDLGAETELEKIAIFQKRIIEVSRKFAKPVIIATELMQSMVEQPQPTKAEVTDISNAVLDGASALMLSAETAVGEYPEIAVQTMQKISKTVEDFGNISEISFNESTHSDIPEAVVDSLGYVAKSVGLTKIICLTSKGYLPSLLSRMRLKVPVIAITPEQEVARKMMLQWGVWPVAISESWSKFEADPIDILKQLDQENYFEPHDVIAITTIRCYVPGVKTNSFEIHKISDLRRLKDWSKV